MKNNNSTTRREFLNQSFFTLMALSMPVDKILKSTITPRKGKEPCLFFDGEDLPRIRENTKLPIFKAYWESMVNADLNADTKFLKDELDIHNHVSHLLRVNEMLKRSAFVALVDENKDHEQLAKLAIEKILTYNEWDYFMEDGSKTIGLQRAPETTMAMSFAYDWLFNKLSESEKKSIIDAIAEKGIPPCYLTLYGMRFPDKVKGWGFNPTSSYKLRFDLSRWPIILNKTNLKMIPLAGLTIGAVLLYDKHTEANNWLEMAKFSLKEFVKIYGKDGSYNEGLGYWGYTTQHLVMCVDILKRKLNIDNKKILNFTGTMKYAVQMRMPTKENPEQSVNFSDSAFVTDTSAGFWVAKEFKDGLSKYAGEVFSTRRNTFSIIWYDQTIKTTEPNDSLNDVRFDIGWMISRSGWNANDTVIAMRSGGPSNHEHADRNSIILKAYGERLFHDPLGAAYSHTEKHWKLRLTESHTAVLIDGKGHQYHDGSMGTNSSNAEAQIVQFKPGKKLCTFTSNATQAYNLVNADVKKVQRTVVFIKPNILIIIDEFEKNRDASAFQIRFQAFNTDNKAKLICEGNKFEIQRPNAKVNGVIFCDLKTNVTQNKIDVPEDKGLFPFVEISTESSLKCKVLTICSVSSITNEEKPEIDVIKIKDLYKINYAIGKDKGSVKLVMKDDYPVVKE